MSFDVKNNKIVENLGIFEKSYTLNEACILLNAVEGRIFMMEQNEEYLKKENETKTRIIESLINSKDRDTQQLYEEFKRLSQENCLLRKRLFKTGAKNGEKSDN